MQYLQKCLTNFQKHLSFAQRGGTWLLLVVSLKCMRHFTFVIPMLQLFRHPEHVKISSFSQYTVPDRNAISSKVLNEFSKTFFGLKEEERGYCGRKFQMHRHFSFAIATLQLFRHPENVKILIFSLTLSRQKCHIFKSI